MPKAHDIIVRVEMTDELSACLGDLQRLVEHFVRDQQPVTAPLPLIAAGLIVAGSSARKVSRRSLLGLGWRS
jgi:hypothetical protein